MQQKSKNALLFIGEGMLMKNKSTGTVFINSKLILVFKDCIF